MNIECEEYTEWLCQDCNPQECASYTPKKKEPIQLNIFDEYDNKGMD